MKETIFLKIEYNRNAGLGNKLFPWARAKVLCEDPRFKLLGYQWFSPRGAGIIRGGINYKYALQKIWLVSNFVKDTNSLNLVRSKILELSSGEKSYISNIEDATKIKDIGKNHILILKWNACHYFNDLQPYRSLINRELENIISSKKLKNIESFTKEEFIGANIRMGNDFIESNSIKNGYRKTSLDWFKNSIEKIRLSYGNLPVFVISDGGPKQLSALKSIPNLKIMNNKSAIEDLLILSKSKVLLGSGNSSFSAWASFLGGMDTFSSPQTPFDHFHINYNNPNQIVSTI